MILWLAPTRGLELDDDVGPLRRPEEERLDRQACRDQLHGLRQEPPFRPDLPDVHVRRDRHAVLAQERLARNRGFSCTKLRSSQRALQALRRRKRYQPTPTSWNG